MINLPEYISASQIKEFNTCQMRYFMSYSLKLSDIFPQFWGTENGSILHEVFEEYAKGINKDWKNNLIHKYQQKRPWRLERKALARIKKCSSCPFAKVLADNSGTICNITNENINTFNGCPKTEIETAIKMAEKIFIENNIIDKYKIVAIEDEFEISFAGGAKIKGYIDLLSEIDKDTLLVTDYKSGKQILNYAEVLKDIQMKVYYYAARKKYPQYKHVLVSMHFLRDKPVIVPFNDSILPKIESLISKIFYDIREIDKPMILNLNDKSVSWRCKVLCNIEKCQELCLQIHGKTREELCN